MFELLFLLFIKKSECEEPDRRERPFIKVENTKNIESCLRIEPAGQSYVNRLKNNFLISELKRVERLLSIALKTISFFCIFVTLFNPIRSTDMADKKFIDIEKVIQTKNEKLYKWLPQFLVNYIKKIVHEDDINTILKENKNLFDVDFCNQIIERFELKVVVEGIENIPKEGAVILAANHSLGGLDAMAVVSGLSKRRKDIRFIVNDILLNLENLKGLFVGVNKHGKSSKESFNSINELFDSDKAVFIFPAGLVSRKKKGEVKDLEWKRTFILKSKELQTPIVPIYIDGGLSNFFYRLSNTREKLGIKSNIEMLYLANEQFKLKGRTITLTIGKPIDPKDLDPTKSNFELAQWVKEQVYLLKK